MKKILKRLATGFLAFATIVTALPTTAVHASEKQYWTESAERVGIVEKVMNDGSIGSTFNEGQAGDLVFFHSTYNAGTYVTHVGIYVGNNQMYHAGDPIGYADLNNSYWQQHLIGAGRIKQ